MICCDADTAVVNCGNPSLGGEAVEYVTDEENAYFAPALLLVVGTYISAPFKYARAAVTMSISSKGSVNTISSTTIDPLPETSPPTCGGGAGICYENLNPNTKIYTDSDNFIALPEGMNSALYVEPMSGVTWKQAQPTHASDLWLRRMGYVRSRKHTPTHMHMYTAYSG